MASFHRAAPLCLFVLRLETKQRLSMENEHYGLGKFEVYGWSVAVRDYGVNEVSNIANTCCFLIVLLSKQLFDSPFKVGSLE